MKQQRVALVEFAGSHDECLLTQMEALHAVGVEMVLVTNQRLLDRNPAWKEYFKTVYFVEPTGKAIGDWRLMRQLVQFLKEQQVTKVVFNTAQGGHIRNLALLLPKQIQCYGIIHTIRKFQGSFTQKIIHRAIKKYVVLSDDLLERIVPPKGINVGSFYPISFPQSTSTSEKPEGQIWITITGGVENRRKDLHSVIDFIRNTPEHIQFIFLGKTDLQHPDAQAFLATIVSEGLSERIRYYTEFVDQTTFDGVLKQTDFLLPLIHPHTPSADQYINNQISGSFTIAFGYHIPLLIHEAYQTEEDLRVSAHFYQLNTFSEQLTAAITDHTALVRRIAQEEKWTKSYQYANYVSFLDIGA